jgi:DNA-binding NtrC family response regulator
LRRQPAQANSRLIAQNGARFPMPDRARLGLMATTILLVDDDPLQAYMFKALLERRFADVRRVADAAEALCLVEQPQVTGTLGLVISRNRLPGIGGPAFVAELHNRRPELPVLVLGEDGEWPAESKGDHVRFLSAESGPGEVLAAAGEMLTSSRATLSGNSRVA